MKTLAFQQPQEYTMILNALERTNRNLGRAVTTLELSRHFTKTEAAALKAANPKKLQKQTNYVLRRLTDDGLIAGSPGEYLPGYYASSRLINELANPFPATLKPLPQRVLELVTGTIEYAGRPVAYGELFPFAEKSPEFSDLGAKEIKRYLHELVMKKKLIRIGKSLEEHLGRFLYALPGTELSEDEELLIASPHRIVKAAFFTIWNDRIQTAKTEGKLPRPILTGEVNRYLAEHNFKFKDKRLLPNTLLYLTQIKDAPLRKIQREGEFFKAWAPVNVSDEQLNLNDLYGSDSERIKTAVRRAVRRLERAVAPDEIMEEIQADAGLSLQSGKSLSLFLNGGAKEKAYLRGKLVRRDRAKSVRRAGLFKGKAFYFYGRKEDELRYAPYVTYLNLKELWEQSGVLRELEEIEGCRLPTVAYGRALLAISENAETAAKLSEVIETGALNAETKREAEIILTEITSAARLAEQWIKNKNVEGYDLPGEVNNEVTGLTAHELLPMVTPFYPAAQKVEQANKLVVLLSRDIRRVKNPQFRSRFCDNPREAAQFLFERTDAFLLIAKRWGGYECCFQAMLASSELGALRDTRFVIPALSSPNADERLGAVACLAFLQNEEGNKSLFECALNDPDPNIRKAGIWAYAFTSQSEAKDLAAQIAGTDLNSSVRDFAYAVSKAEYEELWCF